ncbi:MAG: EamA family transporter [Candidatus Eisenbacteria bacterium]
MIPLVIVFIAVCFSVTGELFLKAGMNDIGAFGFSNLLPTMGKILTHPRILTGFASIGVGAVFWLAALARVELSWAYPMLSLGYILALVLSALFLGESISVVRWIGVLVIVIGVILVSRS